MRKYLIAIVVVLVLFFAFGIYEVKKRKEELAHLPKPIIVPYTVSAAKPKRGELTVYTSYRAKYEPLEKGFLSAKVNGLVEEIYVKEGDSFKKGQILAVVDPIDLKTKLEGLEAKLSALKVALDAAKIYWETQKSIYERNLRLYKTGGISKEQLQISESKLKEAQAKYEEVKANIVATEKEIEDLKHNIETYAQIKAPYDGVVRHLIARQGDFVGAGRPILEIENTKQYRLIAAVPKDTPVGEIAKIYIEGKTYTFKVSKIWPSSTNDLKMVEIDTPKLPIPSDSYVNVKLQTGNCKGYIVPFDSILYLDSGTFVVETDKSLVPVRVGAINGETACVVGNITQPVLVAGQFRLRQIAVHKYPIKIKEVD